jgi:hypothetical protein
MCSLIILVALDPNLLTQLIGSNPKLKTGCFGFVSIFTDHLDPLELKTHSLKFNSWIGPSGFEFSVYAKLPKYPLTHKGRIFALNTREPLVIPLKLNNLMYLESSCACTEVKPKSIGEFRSTQTLVLEFKDLRLSSGFHDLLI